MKPCPQKAFSVDSSLTDIIFVAKKVKPDKDHKVRIICLKVDIDESFTTTDIETITRSIKTQLDDESETADYFTYLVSQRALEQNSSNLMPYIFASSLRVSHSFEKIMQRLRSSRNLIKMNRKLIEDGFQLRPKGKVKNNVWTMRYNDARVSRASLLFEPADDKSDVLIFRRKLKGLEKIAKSSLITTFRTSTGVNRINASSVHDYLRSSVLKPKALKKKRANLILPNRFRLNTYETYLTAFYFENQICPLNAFVMYDCKKEAAKALSLYLNSIFYLVQLLMLTKQSTGPYLEMKQLDFEQVLIPTEEHLVEFGTSFSETFNDLSNRKFESVLTQLERKSSDRLLLDQAIGRLIGVDLSKEELESLYGDVLAQIKSLPSGQESSP